MIGADTPSFHLARVNSVFSARQRARGENPSSSSQTAPWDGAVSATLTGGVPAAACNKHWGGKRDGDGKNVSGVLIKAALGSVSVNKSAELVFICTDHEESGRTCWWDEHRRVQSKRILGFFLRQDTGGLVDPCVHTSPLNLTGTLIYVKRNVGLAEFIIIVVVVRVQLNKAAV